MCFYVNAKDPDVHVAHEDIPVFKLLLESGHSPFMCFKYSPHTTYRIEDPLFSQLNSHVLYSYHDGHRYKCGHIVRSGFHSYGTRESHAGVADCLKCKIVRMFIPKGAKYRVNTAMDEYVSNELRTGSLLNYKE